MGIQEKREYLRAIRVRYYYANRWEKKAILDEFCAICGYNRKYAIGLLCVDDCLEKRSPKRRQARRVKRQERKTGAVQNKEAPNTPSNSRHIPQALRDQVFERDQGQCSFVSEDGVRCDARHGLELHHKEPYAKNGKHTLQNLTLHCAAHNALEAVADFGAEHMTRYLGQGWAGVRGG